MASSPRQSIFSLSSILSLRMFGLFATLPVLALYATHMTGATPTRVGMALGIYGLTQAVFQIPLGAWSDRIGRKPVITIGLLIFISGSLLTACSTSILSLIAGRALQGAGAIGSATMALLADLTPETHRTKAMAVAGMSIGLSFLLALTAGPLLVPYTGVPGIFWLAVILGSVALLVLYIKVPASPQSHPRSEESKSFRAMLACPQLQPLYLGIFLLHALFTATFVVLPISLLQRAGLPEARQWLIYAPALLIAFVLSILMIITAEKKKRLFPFFMTAIVLTGAGEGLFLAGPNNLLLSGAGLLLFFTGFSALEAFIPSLVSRMAPGNQRGTALGIHSSSQFAGIFVGGVAGGWLYGHYGFSAVYIFCILLISLWVFTALRTQLPLRPSEF